MSLRKAAPGEGAGKAHVHFAYVSTMPNKPWNAWVAGPCYWTMAHTTGRSKPCLDWITNGALACARCASVKPAEEIGYQPLYRDIDGRPVMVIVHSYSREQIDALRFRQFVVVGRGAEPADPVMVSAVPGKQTWYSSSLAERQVECDLTETLLRVWKESDLVEWYRANMGAAPTTTRPTPTKSNGEPFSPLTVNAVKRYAPPDPDGPLGATLDIVKERLKNNAERLKPSTNGNHKPKG